VSKDRHHTPNERVKELNRWQASKSGKAKLRFCGTHTTPVETRRKAFAGANKKVRRRKAAEGKEAGRRKNDFHTAWVMIRS